MKRYLFALLAVAGCDDTTDSVVNELNLNRPVDLAFACYGGYRPTGATGTTSAQPIASCDYRNQKITADNPSPVPPGQESSTEDPLASPNYFAFILQSAPGTVEIARWDSTIAVTAFAAGSVVVLDADPLTPGNNAISIGEEPIAIQTDTSGCYEVTANAGSCDMSVLDINSALALESKAIVNRQDVVNAAGVPIRAKPQAMVTQPPTTTIGGVCPAVPSGIMYVAYPSCHLVAAVDVSTGTVKGGIQFDSTGKANIVDGTVTCPIDECGGGGAITAGPRPDALDLEVDPRVGSRRLAIGALASNKLTIVDLDASFMPTATSTQVTLEDKKGDLGITAVALSPQIGMGGTGGTIQDEDTPGGQGQYIYAVATDQSVRVADVLTKNVECDTQVDPRFTISIKDVKQLSCFPVGDAATPPRRAGAVSPGIALPLGTVPTSVTTFRSDPIGAADTRLTGGYKTIGYFAAITSTNGYTFLATIDDDDFYDTAQTTNPLLAPMPLVMAHQLRDGIPNRGALAETSDTPPKKTCDNTGIDPDTGSSQAGGPRTLVDPTRGVPTGVIAAEKVNTLPQIRHVGCGIDPATGMYDGTTIDPKPVSELAFNAPLAQRQIAYPDLEAVRSDEQITMTWEGSLSNDQINQNIDGPGVRTAMMAVDNAAQLRLVDDTHPFCDAGVEPYDIIQLRGCDPANEDRDCPSGYECFVHPKSQVAGLGACMLTSEADRLATACQSFLTSLRRYTVGQSSSGQLTILPRRHHLRSEPLDGCDLANDKCQAIANYAFQLTNSSNPRDITTLVDPHTYACMTDEYRPARAAGKGSCLETCKADADCVAGLVCDTGSGTCMEGVVPPQACVNAPQRFELRSHDAFTVIGTLSGYQSAIIKDPNSDACIKDPNASPTLVGRVPLTAPACDPAADPITGKRPDGTFEPNPCLEATTETEYNPYPNGTPTTTCTQSSDQIINQRATSAIKVRTRGFTMDLVDPTYPGDANCNLDRAGNDLGDLPLVFTGYQLNFRITAGFLPTYLPIGPAYPVKIVRGPSQSLWIVDEGDYLSQTLGVASTLGKVFRLEAQNLGTLINTLE